MSVPVVYDGSPTYPLNVVGSGSGAGSAGATGAAVPANATQVGGADGSGNLQAVTVKAVDPSTSDEGFVVRPLNATAANFKATVTQGPAAALNAPWPVEVTDGTHTLPTGDAVARSVAVQVNDGTNVLGTVAHPVQVNITNGTQSMPTMDVAARAGFVELTDGTRTATVKAASTGPASTDTALVVAPAPSGTATCTNVASSATTVALLAANTARRGATIYNDSTAVLYVKLGTTASTTSYTVQLAPAGTSQAYYEVPCGYQGEIDGIWASANGSARVTELT